MPIYHTLGEIPRKRHTVFRKRDGDGIHYEELMGTYGFDGASSLLYHLHEPTKVLADETLKVQDWTPDPDPHVRMRHFRLFDLPQGGSPVLGRVPVMFNNHVAVSFVQPDQTDDFFYRNSQGDELVFVTEGEGVLESIYGELPYGPDDHLIIHRGILHRLRLGDGPHRYLVIEGAGYYRYPKRYQNDKGQLLEHSPYCERDIRRPSKLVTRDEEGEFEIVVKRQNVLTRATLGYHPFDVVGWDGYYYPWAFNMNDFEPITGSLHQPPPVHQVFECERFVVCDFVARVFDYHPEAIPAPYNHSNVMSDEMLFYANDKFMSRKGIEMGSLTLHPAGFPHGPQPGKYEGSIGKERTEEMALMMDTFDPVVIAKAVTQAEDTSYGRSWIY
ncbi:MAG: Homogentisate 1,2-dioxygenase [Calditrichaeota bacterium]|nr:Homogentisate 1,2-dioxygenase [Calditrichota bacterium]